MPKVTKPAPNRVDIQLEGRLNAETMREGLDTLVTMSEDVANGRMLYTIPELWAPTLGAIGVELRRLPKLFGLLGKFDRCAVLRDAAWIRKTAEIEGALFPGIETKGIAVNDKPAAEAWLSEG